MLAITTHPHLGEPPIPEAETVSSPAVPLETVTSGGAPASRRGESIHYVGLCFTG